MDALRRGQAHRSSHDLFADGSGRILVTVQSAAVIEGRHLNVVRRAARRVEPVACDVGTGALLYDAVALAAKLKAVPRREASKPRPVGQL